MPRGRTGDGLFDDTQWSLFLDPMGRMWMSSDRGVWWVDRDSLNAFAYPIVRSGDELHTFYAGLNFHVIDDYIKPIR